MLIRGIALRSRDERLSVSCAAWHTGRTRAPSATPRGTWSEPRRRSRGLGRGRPGLAQLPRRCPRRHLGGFADVPGSMVDELITDRRAETAAALGDGASICAARADSHLPIGRASRSRRDLDSARSLPTAPGPTSRWVSNSNSSAEPRPRDDHHRSAPPIIQAARSHQTHAYSRRLRFALAHTRIVRAAVGERAFELMNALSRTGRHRPLRP